MKRFSILLLLVWAVTAVPAWAQIDVQNLTPAQQKVFENRLRQQGIEVEYNKLSPAEKERYFRAIRQEDQKRQQAGQGNSSARPVNVNNRYNNTLIPLTDFGEGSYQPEFRLSAL